MGIQEPTPHLATQDPLAQEIQTGSRPEAPAWADESTIAIPLAELFANDAEE
jgi:hypothetical protein